MRLRISLVYKEVFFTQHEINQSLKKQHLFNFDLDFLDEKWYTLRQTQTEKVIKR